MSNLFTLFKASAVFTASFLFVLGCTTGGGTNLSSGGGASIVNSAGQAWIDDYPIGEREGFIIHANGTYTALSDFGNVWRSNGGGRWETEEETLTLSGSGGYYSGQSGVFNFFNNNNTMAFANETLKRTNGVIIGQSVFSGMSSGRDSRLINNAANQAWIEIFSGNDGFILHANGRMQRIYRSTQNNWLINEEATWETYDNSWLAVQVGANRDFFPYTVANNSRITADGRTYNRTNSINTGNANTGPENDARLINTANNQAWIDDWELGERIGFIFRANAAVTVIYEDSPNYWIGINGKWESYNNNELAVTIDGSTDYYPYRLANNNNRMIIDDDWILNRTSNVFISYIFAATLQQEMRSGEIREKISSRLSEKRSR